MPSDTILLDHGAGGRASHELVARVFARHLANPVLDTMDDAAVLTPPPGRLAVGWAAATRKPPTTPPWKPCAWC